MQNLPPWPKTSKADFRHLAGYPLRWVLPTSAAMGCVSARACEPGSLGLVPADAADADLAFHFGEGHLPLHGRPVGRGAGLGGKISGLLEFHAPLG